MQPPPRSFPAGQPEAMRAEIEQLVASWAEREWSLEAASVTLISAGLHIAKAGDWQTLEQLIATIRSAWPLMKGPDVPR